MQEIDHDLLKPNWLALINSAVDAKRHAYAPYSNYYVGAAILDENRIISAGCNVENAAYNGTHAERSAVSNMIYPSRGRRITTIAVATRDGGSPCGDCRQHIWQFCHGDLTTAILLVNEAEKVSFGTIGELLPLPFNLWIPKFLHN